MGVVRIIRKIAVGRNPCNNTTDNLGETGEIHSHSSQDDSLESIYYEETLSQNCGCFAPAGGRCSECRAISCVRCHQHCGGTETSSSIGCGKPLCREHSHYITVADGGAIPFCGRCYSRIARKQRRRRIAGIIFAPFIEREDNNEK